MSDTTAAAKPLRLLAADADDLAVVSAALQDAAAKLGDMAFEGGRFTLAANRFRWEKGRGAPERVRSAVQFGHVARVRSRGVVMGDADTVAAILSVSFDPSSEAEDPAGVVRFTLAGGGEIALDVECIDAVLSDVSEPWAARRAPRHRV